jgi:hypothetical protein
LQASSRRFSGSPSDLPTRSLAAAKPPRSGTVSRSQRFALMLVAAFHAIECLRRSLLAAWLSAPLRACGPSRASRMRGGQSCVAATRCSHSPCGRSEHAVADQSQTDREIITRLWDIVDDPHLNRALGITVRSEFNGWHCLLLDLLYFDVYTVTDFTAIAMAGG